MNSLISTALTVLLNSGVVFAQNYQYNSRALKPLAEQVCYTIINRVDAREECLKFIEKRKIDERVARFCLFENSRNSMMAASEKLDCVRTVADLSGLEKDDKYVDPTVLNEVCGRMASVQDRMKCLKSVKGKRYPEAARTACSTYPMNNKPIDNFFGADTAMSCLESMQGTKVPDDQLMKCFARDSKGNYQDNDRVKGCVKKLNDDHK
jgi:hypothetical protein